MEETKRPRDNRGFQRRLSGTNQPQAATDVNWNKRNAAACFRNPNKIEDWHCDFTGALVAEGLQDGGKYWVNVYVREDRKGRKYLSVVLRPQQKGGRGNALKR
jgi:hypothetical protein